MGLVPPGQRAISLAFCSRVLLGDPVQWHDLNASNANNALGVAVPVGDYMQITHTRERLPAMLQLPQGGRSSTLSPTNHQTSALVSVLLIVAEVPT